MSLRVLSVAYPLAPVSASTAGGAEQVLAQLDAALVSAGHESLVIAPAGSEVAGELLPLPPRYGLVNERSRRHVWQQTMALIEQVLDRRKIDVVHMHGIDFAEYLPDTLTPVLATLHLPLSWYTPRSFASRPGLFVHCVSESQQAGYTELPNLLPPIANGVDLQRFCPGRARRNYVFAMGRICPEKGLHLAIDAAQKADMRILVAGQVFPYPDHERYYREEIVPRLRKGRSKFLGPVGPERKRRLLAGAACVAIPSLAPETSSLVAMEALASGTAVVAFPQGALPSLIRHGHTGFLVNDGNEMVEAFLKADEIDPRCCRVEAELRFDSRRTIARYLEVYRSLAA